MAAVQRKLVHKQFNSPMGLYSQQNVKETLHRELKAFGTDGIEIDDQIAKPLNLANSAVLRAVEEEDQQQMKCGYKRVAWPPASEERIVREFTPQPQTQYQPVPAYNHQQQSGNQQPSSAVAPTQQQYRAPSHDTYQKPQQQPQQQQYQQPPQQQYSPQPQYQAQAPNNQNQYQPQYQPQQPQGQVPQYQPQQPQGQVPQYQPQQPQQPQGQYQQQPQQQYQQPPWVQQPQQQAAAQQQYQQPPWVQQAPQQQYQQPPQQQQQQQPQYQTPSNQYQAPHQQQYQPPQPQQNQFVSQPNQQFNSYSQPQQQQHTVSHDQLDNLQQQQHQPQDYRGASPGIITLRKEAPVTQAPAPVYTSQPAAVSYQGGCNMRGDLKWPPPEYKEAAAKENEERKQLAAGPVCRPRKVKRDYTPFFAKNALSHHYPSYKVPPGTQHMTY